MGEIPVMFALVISEEFAGKGISRAQFENHRSKAGLGGLAFPN